MMRARCCQSNRNLSAINADVVWSREPQAMSAGLVGFPVDEASFEVEVVVDAGMDRGELLQALHLPEPEHCSLSSSERQV